MATNERSYKKIIDGGSFKWFINPSDMTDIAGTAESCLGLTRGGNINLGDNELKQIVADGQLGMVRGGQRITDIQPEIQLTLLQWNKEVIKGMRRFLVTETTGQTVIRPKGILEDLDYIDKLVGIGKTTDGTLIVVVLENAILNTLQSFDLPDKDEVAYQLTFRGTYDSPDSVKVPISISIIEPTTNQSVGTEIAATLSVQEFSVKKAPTITDGDTLRQALITQINEWIQTTYELDTKYPDAEHTVDFYDGINTLGEASQGAVNAEFYLRFKFTLKNVNGPDEGTEYQEFQAEGRFHIKMIANT